MKIGRKQTEAIAALLAQPSIAEAARVAGIADQTLLRWMKDWEFDAEYRAAKRAEHRQSMARLGQGATGAVKSILQIMYHGKKPAMRLQAARAVIRLAKEANDMEGFAAAVAEAKRLINAAQAGDLPTGERGRARMTGHGAKFPRKKEKAIAALLVQRSVAAAAGTTGIGTQTLYRWMQHPAFIAEYAAAAVAVFGPAMRLAQQREGDAVSIIRSFSVDLTIPEETRLQADLYIAHVLKANLREDLESRVAEMAPADARAGEPAMTGQTIGRSLHQQLERVRASLQASKPSGIRRMILVHAVDGKPAGSSVVGPAGRHVWWDPPEGCKKGEPVEEQKGPVQDFAA